MLTDTDLGETGLGGGGLDAGVDGEGVVGEVLLGAQRGLDAGGAGGLGNAALKAGSVGLKHRGGVGDDGGSHEHGGGEELGDLHGCGVFYFKESGGFLELKVRTGMSYGKDWTVVWMMRLFETSHSHSGRLSFIIIQHDRNVEPKELRSE